jgi:hypothetical protein
VKASFIPGDSHLTETEGGLHVVLVGGSEIFRSRSQKAAAAKFNDLRNITLGDVNCRYLTFTSEWWDFAAEFALITHYRPEWNESGFGNRAPADP